MLYKKSQQIIDKWTPQVKAPDSIASISKSNEAGDKKQYDWIYLGKSKPLSCVCGVGEILFSPILEVDDCGDTSILMPLTTETIYRAKTSDDPFVKSAYQVFEELKQGEHLEVQWDSSVLQKDSPIFFLSPKTMSIEHFKRLYLEFIDGIIYICTKIQIREEEFVKRGGDMVEEIARGVKESERGAFAMREVMCIHKKYW